MKKTNKVLSAAVMVALSFVAAKEGKVNKPYVDVAGVVTQCYGDTQHVEDIEKSDAECITLLKDNLNVLSRRVMHRLDEKPSPRTLASFVSLTYNIGLYSFTTSTVRYRWNNGDKKGACSAILMWNKITVKGIKEVNQGLVNRRKEENKLCLSGLN